MHLVPGRPAPPELFRLLARTETDDPDAPLGGPTYHDDPQHLDDDDLEYGLYSGRNHSGRPRNLLWSVIAGKRPEYIALSESLDLASSPVGRGRGRRRRRSCTGKQIASSFMIGISLLSLVIFLLSPSGVDIEDPLSKGVRTGLFGVKALEDLTETTRGVAPLPCHSHNDYWRSVPLFEAIHYGCTGVEADVWHFADDDELYVGHDTRSLRKTRSFASLYVDPLRRLLDLQNAARHSSNEPANGVFSQSPDQTLVLLVDFKTDGASLWPHVVKQLEPLRSKGYLTHFDGERVVEGPITVVGTGYAPFDLVISNTTYRDIFFDAPLALLSGELFSALPRADFLSMLSWMWANMLTSHKVENTKGIQRVESHTFTLENSYYASASFTQSFGWPWLGKLSEPQKHDLRKQVQIAQERGLKVRYWSTPDWPIGWRDRIRRSLLDVDVDFLNMDKLQEAAGIDWPDRKND